MRVVLVMGDPPLPFGNASAREYYAVFRSLVARKHEVTVFTGCASERERADVQQLFPADSYDLRCYRHASASLPSRLRRLHEPYSYPFSQELSRDLAQELSRPYDVLHLEQTWSGYLARQNRRALLNVHSLGAVDFTARGAPLGNALTLRRLLWAERRLLRAFRHLRTLSGSLRQALKVIHPDAQVHSIPLALDASLYPWTKAREDAGPVISLFGSMTWEPNRSAAERFITRLWPAILRQLPEARAEVVGWNARDVFARYERTPGLRIEQNVPDMRPYFARSTVLVYAPRAASGMKVKVLEALASGVPVVTTAEGIEGLPAENRVHAAIGETDSELVDATVRLARDVLERQRMARAGRTLVERICNPTAVVEQLEEAYRAIAAG